MTAVTNAGRKALGIFTVAILALLFTGMTNGLSAQTQEGTVITNEATANFTDANGNVYTAVSGSVDVTVAFQGGLDVTSNATASPLSPSVNNILSFDIANNGNGTDTVSVGITTTDTDVTNVTELRYVDAGGDTTVVAFNTDLATTIGDLNTALAADSIPLGGSIQVLVVYTVGPAEGDNTSNVQLTATSTRTGGDSDNSTTAVTPPTTGAVQVTAPTDVEQLPNSTLVTTYSATFTVANASTSAQLIDLVASVDGTDAAGVTIVSVNGTSGSTANDVSFTAGETNSSIVVVYTVANGSGTTTVTLTGSVTGDPIPSDNDAFDVTGVQPVIAVTKSVHASEANALAGTPDLSANPQPGDTIWYRIEVTNTGTASAVVTGTNEGATQMQVTDDLTGLPVTYVATSLVSTGSPGTWATLQKTGDLITGTIATLSNTTPNNIAYFVFAVVIN